MTESNVPSVVRVLLDEHDACRHHLRMTASALARSGTGDRTAEQTALAQTWMLLAYLEGGLEAHIAKEEGPLFPRLKAALPADDRLIDEMVAEHDLIRMKRDDVRAVLDELTDAHKDVRQSRSVLRSSLGGQPSISDLKRVTTTIADKLDVHFQNEEDLVFPLVPELLTAEELSRIEHEMRAVESGR